MSATGFILCAFDLFDYARREGVTHVHAHSCADAPHLVALVHLMGGGNVRLPQHGKADTEYDSDKFRIMLGANELSGEVIARLLSCVPTFY